MADTQAGARARQFATVLLPWLIGAGALFGYGLTLNHWVSLHSLPAVARICGWDWQPQLQRPLTFCVFLPFRFLPAPWIPVALNGVTAVCAALTLVLLARSVALWPQDRTRPQWWREQSEFAILSTPTAWLPPLVAALACGLQLTFWENATSASGEILDLLIFAWVIHAFLQFRITERQCWLSSAAFCFAAGITDNWTFIIYLPAFLAAVLWLKGFNFFEVRFLGRMTAWALAGLCLYLVLPALNSWFSPEHLDFWPALKANLKAQKGSLVYFPKATLAAMAFTVGVPLLAITICWRGKNPNFGDDSLVGSILAKSIFHFVHAVFLFASLWLMLDPPFSPRMTGLGLPFLTQYYISSLVIGYCVGYFILVGSIDVPKYVAVPTLVLLGLLACAVPAALLWRNVAQIRATNGPVLRDFARQLCAGLPPGRSVVLSDDGTPLFLVRAELAGQRAQEPRLINARMFLLTPYQRFLAREYKSEWPFPTPTNRVAVIEVKKAVDMLGTLASRMPMLYLQPSFSYCFERFAAQPHDAIELLTLRTNDSSAAMPDAIFSSNEQYWRNQWTSSLNRLALHPALTPDSKGGFVAKLARTLRLTPEKNATVAFVNAAYSKSLDDWGVDLQRSGRWNEAGVWFQRAIELEPENLAARINLAFTEDHRRGQGRPLNREAIEKEFLDLFTRHRNWEALVSADGPVDEPTFDFETARVLLARGNSRQAAIEFGRCAELAPGWIEPHLWLAQTYVNEGDYGLALRATKDLPPASLPSDGSGLAQYLFCRATALQGLNRTNEAARCISDFVAQHPEQEEVLSLAARLYLQQMAYQPALGVFDQLLRHEPGRLEFLSNKGLAEIQLSQYEQAISTLTEALDQSPSNQIIRLNRAIANLRAGQLDRAAADYKALLELSPNVAKVLFGLGEIAWRKQDTNAAIEYYERCLTNNLPDAGDRRLVAQRLEQLKAARRN